MKYPQLASVVPLRYGPALAPRLRFGTANVVDVIAASPDARWTAFAQPVVDTNGDGVIAANAGPHGSRFGDRMQPLLAWDDGTIEPVDDFIDGSRDGRFIAIVRDGALRVMDTLTRHESPLDGARTPVHRLVSDAFDAEGTRFVWVRSGPDGDRVVVRSLASGRDRVLAPIRGALHRACIDESGSWVFARVVPRDTNGDGTPDPRGPRRGVILPLCLAPGHPRSGPVGVADVSEVWAARADDGELRPRPGFVTVAGRFLVQRRPDGALVATTPDGASEVWSAPGCQGEVLARSPSLERLLVVCRTSRAVSLHGPTTHCALPLHAPSPRDEPAVVADVAFVEGTDGATHRTDLAAAQVDAEPIGNSPSSPTIGLSRFNDHAGVSGGLWISLVEGAYALVHDERVIAIDVHGRMLLAEGADAVDGWSMRRGPLVWRRPLFTPLRFGWTSGAEP